MEELQTKKNTLRILKRVITVKIYKNLPINIPCCSCFNSHYNVPQLAQLKNIVMIIEIITRTVHGQILISCDSYSNQAIQRINEDTKLEEYSSINTQVIMLKRSARGWTDICMMDRHTNSLLENIIPHY